MGSAGRGHKNPSPLLVWLPGAQKKRGPFASSASLRKFGVKETEVPPVHRFVSLAHDAINLWNMAEAKTPFRLWNMVEGAAGGTYLSVSIIWFWLLAFADCLFFFLRVTLFY